MPLNTFKHKIDYLMLRTFLQIIDFLHIVNNDVYSSFKCLEKHFSGWLHATFISISKTSQLFNNALLKSLSHQVSFGVSDFPILDRRVLPIYQNIFFFPDINKLHQTTKKSDTILSARPLLRACYPISSVRLSHCSWKLTQPLYIS